MRLATYLFNGQRCVGVVSPDGQSVRALDLPPGEAQRGVLALIEFASAGRDLAGWGLGESIAVSDISLLAPMPIPRRNIFCVGRNYHAHAKELSGSVFKANSTDTAAWPIVFTKVPECVVGPAADVLLPANVSSQIDYEAELAVVIGAGGKNISRESALNHIFGYTIVNDVTARDVQMRHQQWDLGKSFDTFCPMGPWIITADEFDGADTRVRCWVNGELRQDARTRDFIFNIPALIETCSRGITLFPGDIIATGTPAGVGMGLNPPQYLKPNDRVRIEIDNLGSIENRFV